MKRSQQGLAVKCVVLKLLEGWNLHFDSVEYLFQGDCTEVLCSHSQTVAFHDKVNTQLPVVTSKYLN